MTRNIKIVRLVAILVAAMVLAGCGTKVARVSASEVTDLSGRWNDTDSRLVSEEMVQDVLSRPWFKKFSRNEKRAPVVIIGEVRNLSHEHINVRTFINDLERALINSGEVEFVASSDERDEIRQERREQDTHASEETRKEMGQEAGADFMLKGSINSIIDSEGTEQVKFYQVDLNLIKLIDNRKVWAGQKKIKKLVDKDSIRF